MSQAGYELFNNICELCLVLLHVIFLLIIWVIFFRPEKEKKAVVSAGIFAAVSVVLYLCPAVPVWGRYVISAAIVLGYCRIKYGRHLERAVFTLLLFYNFHSMSFLISNSLYQYLMNDMLGKLDVQNADYMFYMYRCYAISQSLNVFFIRWHFCSW